MRQFIRLTQAHPRSGPAPVLIPIDEIHFIQKDGDGTAVSVHHADEVINFTATEAFEDIALALSHQTLLSLEPA